MPSRRVVTGETIVVDGLRQLQAGLAQVDPALKKELQAAFKEAGALIAETAADNIGHKTGRHGNTGKPLAQTLRVSATSTALSLYSNAPHAGVQDQGGQVGRGHLTLLKRGEVSQYMTRAVTSDSSKVEEMIEGAVSVATAALGGA